MAIVLEQVEGRTCMHLEGAFDISVAEELRAALQEGIASASDVHLDLSAATYLDVTAVQLLWAAQREGAAKGTRWTFDAPIPDAIRETLADAGLRPMLALLDQRGLDQPGLEQSGPNRSGPDQRGLEQSSGEIAE